MPTGDPAAPATHCADPDCIVLEAEYKLALRAAQIEAEQKIEEAARAARIQARTQRALARARRTFGEVETIRDERFM